MTKCSWLAVASLLDVPAAAVPSSSTTTSSTGQSGPLVIRVGDGAKRSFQYGLQAPSSHRIGDRRRPERRQC